MHKANAKQCHPIPQILSFLMCLLMQQKTKTCFKVIQGHIDFCGPVPQNGGGYGVEYRLRFLLPIIFGSQNAYLGNGTFFGPSDEHTINAIFYYPGEPI